MRKVFDPRVAVRPCQQCRIAFAGSICPICKTERREYTALKARRSMRKNPAPSSFPRYTVERKHPALTGQYLQLMPDGNWKFLTIGQGTRRQVEDAATWPSQEQAESIAAQYPGAYVVERYIKNPAPRIGTRNIRRRSQATGRFQTQRLLSRRQRNTRKGYFPNPRDAQRLQREHYMAINPKRQTSHKIQRGRRQFKADVILGGRQFFDLPIRLQEKRKNIWKTFAAFRSSGIKRAKQYARTYANFERVPVRLIRV